MKRLLAMLISMLFAVTNNVSYQMSGDVPFQVDGYYKITGEEPTDYRSLYSDGVNVSAIGKCTDKFYSVSELLKTRRFSGVTPERVTSDDRSYAFYWVEANGLTMDDIRNIGTVYTFEHDGYIVVPDKSKILSSKTDSGGHSIILEDCITGYRYVFNNMERWCCDLNRGAIPDEDGTVNWVHTVSLTGKEIGGGKCIGIATQGETTFEIMKPTSDETVSIYEYYNNLLSVSQ